jgi:hypothetical protein
MNYLLVENKEIVHLGPVSWRPRFIQSELDDLEVDFIVNPTETGYVKINDSFEIIPIVADVTPEYDPLYNVLAGPFYTYDLQADGLTYGATVSHTVSDNTPDGVRPTLKQQVAAERYRRENLGTTATVQDQLVTVDTSRDNRNTIVQAFLLMSDTDTVQWKFPEGFVNLTYADAEAVVKAGATYIQAQFNWEAAKNAELDACATLAELRAVEIVPIVVPPVVPGE